MAALRRCCLLAALLALAANTASAAENKTLITIFENNGLTLLKDIFYAIGTRNPPALMSFFDPVAATFLAPTNKALGDLLSARNLTSREAMLANAKDLYDLVCCHMVLGLPTRSRDLLAAEELPSKVLGFTIRVAGGQLMGSVDGNTAHFVKKDLYTDKKRIVVHIIDNVLLPETEGVIAPSPATCPNACNQLFPTTDVTKRTNCLSCCANLGRICL